MIKIENLKPGMVFSSPVYIDDENVLVRSNEPLKSSDIEKLLKWGIHVVYTDGEVITSNPREETILKENSNKSVKDLENIKLHKDYSKFRDYKEEFSNRLVEIGVKLRANFKDLVEKKQFNNNEILLEALYLANQIVDNRFFPLYLTYPRFSDDIIVHHSIHAACYAGFLGKTANLSKIRIQDIIFSVMIMDIGMYFISPKLRQKNFPLTDEEKKIFFAHTIYGYKILTQNAYVKQPLALVALQHHENYDGTGYPKKLKKDEISLLARIAAVADRYTAMLEDRYHRKAKIPYEAMKILLSQESSHLNPVILKFFLEGLSIYPVGSLVLLSNHYKALVIQSNNKSPLRPLVRLLYDNNNKYIEELKFIDLSLDPTITIINVLNPANENINIFKIL